MYTHTYINTYIRTHARTHSHMQAHVHYQAHAHANSKTRQLYTLTIHLHVSYKCDTRRHRLANVPWDQNCFRSDSRGSKLIVQGSRFETPLDGCIQTFSNQSACLKHTSVHGRKLMFTRSKFLHHESKKRAVGKVRFKCLFISTCILKRRMNISSPRLPEHQTSGRASVIEAPHQCTNFQPLLFDIQ